MPLQKTFRELSERLRTLRDSFLTVQLTIREDAPSEGGVVLVDNFGDALDDCVGWLEDGLTAAAEGEAALAAQPNLEVARRALANCQEQFQRMQQRFQAELVCYERLRDLTAFGRSRRGEWWAWVKTVRGGLEGCQMPMEQAVNCFLECWHELSERAAINSVYVQSTNIGQQIATTDNEEVVRGRFT